MKTKYFRILIVFLTLFSIRVSGQFAADSIFIYKDFKQHGTTSNLWHNHKKLDSLDAPKIRLDTKGLGEFKAIFKVTKKKKSFQQKHGGDICYAIVYNNGYKSYFVMECSLSFGLLEDLTTRKRWTLDDPERQKQFYELIKKNWP